MFDRFDVCEAYYLFAVRFHKGQFSPEYQILGRLHNMQFRPGASLSNDSLTENGRTILASLIRRARRGETIGRIK